MTTLEDRLREALAERATLSPVDPGAWVKTDPGAWAKTDPGAWAKTDPGAWAKTDPGAWAKTVARSRSRRLRWHWPARTGLLVPLAAAAAVAVVIVAAATLAGHVGPGPKPLGPASASPSGPPPGEIHQLVREIPPVTPFVPISLFADGHQVRDFLWFGYVPGHAAAGIALCQLNEGGFYDGYQACTSGRLPVGVVARSAATDGSGWIRLGVTARQVTSVTALLPGGHTVRGVVESAHGIKYKVWAVSYPVASAARVVFGDAAGHEVTHLDMPGEQPAPSRPSHGGIALFRYGNDMLTAYRISGGRIGFWAGDNSMWSDVPVSESALNALETGSTRSSAGSTPDDWFGYAPSGTARIALRLADGRQFASRTIPGWPGSGVVFWGPLTLPAQIPMPYDMIVITYDAAGHVLRQVPIIFLG